jgi:hypothetical protein
MSRSRIVFFALFFTFALAVTFAAITTAKHLSGLQPTTPASSFIARTSSSQMRRLAVTDAYVGTRQ